MTPAQKAVAAVNDDLREESPTRGEWKVAGSPTVSAWFPNLTRLDAEALFAKHDYLITGVSRFPAETLIGGTATRHEVTVRVLVHCAPDVALDAAA